MVCDYGYDYGHDDDAEFVSEVMMLAILTSVHVRISMSQKFTMCSKDARIPIQLVFWLD